MDTLNGQLAVASVFITFVLCYIFVYLKGTTRKQRFAQKVKAQGCVTKGTSIRNKTLRWYDTNETTNRQITTKVTYVYQVDGVEYKKKLSYYEQHDSGPLPPQTINIYYSPTNPKKCVGGPEISRQSQMQAGCLVTMFLPFLVGVAVNLLVKFLIS